MRRHRPLLTAGSLVVAACSGNSNARTGDATLPPGAVEVLLEARVPGRGSDGRLMWSPYGKQLPLAEADGGYDTRLALGPEGTPPIHLRLARSDGASHFDRLSIDLDRNGVFEESEVLKTTPVERNHRVWSSFDAVVEIPVRDPVSGDSAVNSYPLSLWYVEDPRVPAEQPVIRFSRQGYMQGAAVLEGVEAVVLVTESVMDGVYGREDSWALASADSAGDVLKPATSRSMDEHAWLFEKAFKILEVDPSGRRLVVAPFDPGITRAEEEEMNDELKVDREAARSGRAAAFLRDFSHAEALAREERKALLVDFETTWCGPCKLMDEWVYTADAVVDAAASVVAVKVDGDEQLELKDRFGVSGFPTLILLSFDGEELRRVSGYVNVVDMVGFLEGEG